MMSNRSQTGPLILYERKADGNFPKSTAVCSKMFDDNLDNPQSKSCCWHGLSGPKDSNDILINLPADKISVTFKVSIFVHFTMKYPTIISRQRLILINW